jgi:hypothetical protein
MFFSTHATFSLINCSSIHLLHPCLSMRYYLSRCLWGTKLSPLGRCSWRVFMGAVVAYENITRFLVNFCWLYIPERQQLNTTRHHMLHVLCWRELINFSTFFLMGRSVATLRHFHIVWQPVLHSYLQFITIVRCWKRTKCHNTSVFLTTSQSVIFESKSLGVSHAYYWNLENFLSKWWENLKKYCLKGYICIVKCNRTVYTN